MNRNFLNKLPQITRDHIIESLIVSIYDRNFSFTVNPVLVRECIDALEKEGYICCNSVFNKYDLDKIDLTEYGKTKLDTIYPKYMQIIPLSQNDFFRIQRHP